MEKQYGKRIRRTRVGPKAEIHINLLKTTLKISNWKTPGHDGIHGFGSKKFPSIYDRLALEINRCLQGPHVHELMTKGKSTLIQKNPSKGTAPNNYRPITYRPMMCTILTAQIREGIYYSQTSRGLVPKEQKGCRKGSRGTAELLYIDQHILNESKSRRKNQEGLFKGLEDLEAGGRVETIQTTTLLRTARILRRVLET